MKSTITLTVDVEHEEGDGVPDKHFSDAARALVACAFKKLHTMARPTWRIEPDEPSRDKYWADGTKHPEFCDTRCYPYGCNAMDREDWEELCEDQPWPGGDA